MHRRAALLIIPLSLAAFAHHGPARFPVRPAPIVSVAADSSFARLIASLSEPGGYFDSDNLLSNEAT
jgi:hypothetical protein